MRFSLVKYLGDRGKLSDTSYQLHQSNKMGGDRESAHELHKNAIISLLASEAMHGGTEKSLHEGDGSRHLNRITTVGNLDAGHDGAVHLLSNKLDPVQDLLLLLNRRSDHGVDLLESNVLTISRAPGGRHLHNQDFFIREMNEYVLIPSFFSLFFRTLFKYPSCKADQLNCKILPHTKCFPTIPSCAASKQE